METTALKQNQLVQNGRELLKVSTIYSENRVSASVVYPVPPRTTVRYYSAEQVEAWREPTNQLIARYEIAWGYRKSGTCDANAKRGTGTGPCDRPLDEHGYCGHEREHIDA